MHIPSSASQAVALLPFEEALALSGRSGDYDAEKWLYVPDFYTEYRYILGTRGRNPLICIGINPSTAVARIAAGNAYDSWIMFNVYAQRATRPDDMDRELNEDLHRENMKAFAYILSHVAENGHAPAIWAAWGTILEKRPYLPLCVREMVRLGQEYGGQWLCAGKCSNKGHPHHPLYLRKDEKVRPFDIEGYLNSL